jgi:hypothetical protein
MQENTHERKHVRGSSPHQEPKQEFDHWLKDIRSISQEPEDRLTAHAAENPGTQQEPPPIHEASSGQPADDEERWKDDGGQSH